NGANFAEADLRHHPLKTGALDAACSGTAKIIIDHLDLGPAKCSQAIAHGVLQRPAPPVVQNLMSRRLANVEDRFALQMLGVDLVRDHDRPNHAGMPPMVGAFSANRSICCGTRRRADLCLLWPSMGLSLILVARER